MHAEALEAMRRMVQRLPAPPRLVYEVGSLDVNGQIRHLFPQAERYLGVDAVAGPGVDVVADATTYEPPFAPDCIACSQVLEHCATWREMIEHLVGLLADGGALLITCAGPMMLPHSAHTGAYPPAPGEYYEGLTRSAVGTVMRHAGLKDVSTWTARTFSRECHTLSVPVEKVEFWKRTVHRMGTRVTIPHVDVFASGFKHAD